ncbi:MAG: hypothetical protein LWY06_03855 [Firmicutes bacterium]|nr:hypothetical protein [Bacillota bacterium]
MAEKNTPKNEKTEEKKEKTGKGLSVPLIVVIAIFSFALGFYIHYFHMGGREHYRQNYSNLTPNRQDPAKQAATNSDEALKTVKEFKMPHTTMVVAALLDLYKKKKQEETGSEVLAEGWRMEEAADKPERGRYYNVYHDWKVKGEKLTFIWIVDLKEKTVEPASDSVKDLIAFDETLLKSIGGGTETAGTPEPSPTSTTGSFVDPKGKPMDPIKLKPLKKEDQSIDILPPVPAEVTSESPKEVHSVSKKPQLDPIIPDQGNPEYSAEPAFELKGVVTSGGVKKALITGGSGNNEVSVGQDAGGGWKVSSISSDRVVVKKGSATQTITLRGSSGYKAPQSGGGGYMPPPTSGGSGYSAPGDSGNYPKAGEYTGSGNYPKAGSANNGNYPKANVSKPGAAPKAVAAPKRTNGGPPVIPAAGSGEAPPIPPAPSKKAAAPANNNTPDDKPTIIPLD